MTYFRGLVIVLLLLCATLTAAQDEEEAVSTYYRGVDLSYVNEMEDCGAVYHINGEAQDPYSIFQENGANLVRLRLWHNPTWTKYSNLEDVERSLKRVKALGMAALLDFHYSDTWADPSKQIIPAAWADLSDEELGEAVYQYTYDTLMHLDSLDLMPDMVQVGNEINTEVMRPEDTPGYPINWERNVALINQGIKAVRDASDASGKTVKVMLHVAKPEEVEGWLLAAQEAGISHYDIVGISYYPGWSMHTVKTVGKVITQLRHKFNTDVIVAETGYPWTMDGVDESAGNIMNEEFLVDEYPATPEGQRDFLIDLTQQVFASGGLGVVYWEPAWVSTSCRTLWGQGSHWENGTFFDFRNENEALPAMEFLSHDYTLPVDVTIKFHFEDATNAPEEIFFQGGFTGMGKRTIALPLTDGEYVLHTRLLPDTPIHYQFYSALPAKPETALLPSQCLDDDGTFATCCASGASHA
jgi:arabinogalactan endo-1,4-beta-galactosidase